MLPSPSQCSSIGASICYLLSKTLFSDLVERSLKDRLAMWANQVRRNRSTIFSYMLFLRVTPFFPNWFINIASPHVGVPLPVFFVATFIGMQLALLIGETCRSANQAGSGPCFVKRPGVVPLSILPVGGGYSIQTLSDWSDITLFTKEWPYINTTLLTIITGSAVVSLLPLLATRQKGRFA